MDGLSNQVAKVTLTRESSEGHERWAALSPHARSVRCVVCGRGGARSESADWVTG